MQVAADEAGLQPEDLVAAAEASPQKAALLAEALVAAGRAVTEERIAALGRSLVAGVLTDDEVMVGAERVVVAALADLEPLHLAALAVAARRAGAGHRRGARPRRPGHVGVVARRPHRAAARRGRSPAGPVIATLLRHGLVRDAAIGTYDYSPRYDTTDFARLCLNRLTLVTSVSVNRPADPDRQVPTGG